MIVDAKFPSPEDIQALGNRTPECSTDSLDSFHDVVVTKPWGKEYLMFENTDVAIWILKIEAGQKTSMHCHPGKNTSLIVLGGRARCRTLEKEHEFLTEQGIYIGKGVFHQSINPGSKPLFMMEIESPVDKFDLVRLEDGYGRVDCGYESAQACDKKENLTIDNSLSGKAPIKTRIGDIELSIGFLKTLDELDTLLNPVTHAILSILDRHVWTSDGEKFYEVGEAFRFNRPLSKAGLNINTGFHYLLMSR